ncbi:FtsX-like permease family protein [Streptomyces sp. LaPpAH-108]|uniref:FtsX-like permease family protein n=1 Tax=Streptomyces sp. LaPpAH-108 TaxID=1155714 RepID=UPI0003692A3B|nr:FtsX-like permease family protein [Streptomyces sp. LaPpAH-108]
MSLRQYARDLGMGVRFAMTGGREGWVRTALTAVGVGIGVALLLLTTAIPRMLDARSDRELARQDFSFSATDRPKADDTVVVAATDTWWHDKNIRGRLLDPEGPKAPLPPGLNRFPAEGEMLVSPALRDLLASPGARLLRERLPYKITGTIGESGLVGPRELSYYAGAEDLKPRAGGARTNRLTHFGQTQPWQGKDDPVLLLLTTVVFVTLLLPVAVFVAAAVRFGGERRDRRLAALRLVGADGRTTRRIAAGEALAGAVLGLLVGAVLFLAGRHLAPLVEIRGESFFPSYVTPSPVLVALVVVAVPVCAVLVTLFAMRTVVVEPLGVVRAASTGRRRLWWRLLLPLSGLAMLWPMLDQGRVHGDFNQFLVIGGVLLLLVGVTALLPWLVEWGVLRLGSGPLSWQLAVRRLQLSGDMAARTVNGIAVAVAGAIALQMLFAGVQDQYVKDTGHDPTRAQIEVDLTDRTDLTSATEAFARTEGVRASVGLATTHLGDKALEPASYLDLVVGDCAALRELARLPSCHDGDMFTVNSPGDSGAFDRRMRESLLRPGRPAWIDPRFVGGPGLAVPLRLPAALPHAAFRADSLMHSVNGLLITPSALPAAAGPALSSRVFLRLDSSVPDAREYVRNTAARVDPVSDVLAWAPTTTDGGFASLRTGLFIGATCVLALIGASLLVAQLEQLRERRRLLSVLVAFGTRRRTLGLSVLWQAAVPIALGVALASVVGLALGAVLLRMTATPVRVDWPSVLSLTGVGAAMVAAVTLLSLPPLLRLTRPEGLRAE